MACNSQLPLFSQKGPEMIALDEQHLDQLAAHFAQGIGVVLDHDAIGDGWMHAAWGRPLTSTVHTRQLPHGVSPRLAHRWGM